ncbi:hypothetical protein [Cyanobium sp. CH-040]|uniref:hypothetical protein n=1 Tax=Cyanobium sp. CH-040 TaxID=2823708 RepID=UPI0020CCFCAF|nr:hypothetical protein [Cyanobium sp. CH-040]MCP9926551.1 hypothetical protein [Cyanobium sp. CH-040]
MGLPVFERAMTRSMVPLRDFKSIGSLLSLKQVTLGSSTLLINAMGDVSYL